MPAHIPKWCRAPIGASASLATSAASLVAAAVLVACEPVIADRLSTELALAHAEKSSATA